MKRQYGLLVLVSVSILFSIGCDKLFGIKEPLIQSAEKEINGPLLAQAGDWRIGLDDFERQLESLKSLAEEQGLDINDYEFKRNILNELVKTALLAEEAKARGIDRERDIVEALEAAKQSLLAQRLINDTIKDITVTDVEIENYYEQNKDKLFQKPPELKLREIVVNSETLARDLYIRILQRESFSSLARQYSVASSKDKGGDLGYIRYDPEQRFDKFWQRAFLLEKGEVSNIFKGDDHKYYILKLEDKKEGGLTPLSEVKDAIEEKLKIDKRNMKIEGLVDAAKAREKVEINEHLLR